MTSVTALAQLLEPGQIVQLFELDATALGGDRMLFHAHNQVETITWQGAVYYPWPVTADGFERTSDQPPTPTLSVGNVNGSISSLCIFFDDLVGARFIRRRTLGRFLDAVNFPEGNPEANPAEEFEPEVWFIELKKKEDNETVDFELASALDFNGVNLPRRQIIANNCQSTYRSAECSYTGGPVADETDQPVTELNSDRCGKRLSSCELRFGEGNPLPFGGFPAAGLLRS
jgi:lambda family phage minor tail protein L